MNSLIQADIFFFITSIAVIVITLAVLVLLVYGIKIARTISHISESVKKQSDEILTDIHQLRERVKSESMKVSTFWKFVSGFILHRAADAFTSRKTKKQSKQHDAHSSGSTKKKQVSERGGADDVNAEDTETDAR